MIDSLKDIKGTVRKIKANGIKKKIRESILEGFLKDIFK